MVIYLVENLANGKRYVGQTTYDLSTRWRDHLYAVAAGSQAILHKAIRKYGPGSFTIKEIARAYSLEELDFLEIRFINWLGTLAEYNQAEGGRNNRKGVKASEDTKARLKTAWVARKARGDHRKSGDPVPWLESYKFKTGRKLTVEERQILSKTQSAGWTSEARARQSEAQKHRRQPFQSKRGQTI